MSVIMVVFSQTHYHAYISCAALFMADLIAHFRLKIKKINMIPYIVLGVCTIPSAIRVLRSRFIEEYTALWMPTPDISVIRKLISYFATDSEFLIASFWLGMAFMIAYFICHVSQPAKNKLGENGTCDSRAAMVRSFPAWMIVFVVTVFYVYGHVNIKASLWYNRYFTDLLPSFFVICAYCADRICRAVTNVSSLKREANLVIVIFICFATLLPSLSLLKTTANQEREKFRVAADNIYQEVNYIFDDSTAVVLVTAIDVTQGWDRYYITRYGRRDSLNLINMRDVTEEELTKYTRLYIAKPRNDPYYATLRGILSEHYDLVTPENSSGVAVYEMKKQ